ncbi:MAG: GlgB N-terminal domain-containing protein, partial [Pseudomonas sp.]
MSVRPPQAASGLSAADLQALIRAEHGDPFAVLGPHADATGTVLR